MALVIQKAEEEARKAKTFTSQNSTTGLVLAVLVAPSSPLLKISLIMRKRRQ